MNLNVFGASHQSTSLSNIGDWSSRYDVPVPITEDSLQPIPRRRRSKTTYTHAVTLVESDEDGEDDEDDKVPRWHSIPEGGRKHSPTLFDGGNGVIN